MLSCSRVLPAEALAKAGSRVLQAEALAKDGGLVLPAEVLHCHPKRCGGWVKAGSPGKKVSDFGS